MGARLQVDTETLTSAGTNVRTVATELKYGTKHSQKAADAVGHADLADALLHFAKSWDDRREAMLEGIETLAEQATTAGEAFEQLDGELAAAIRGEA